MWVYGISFSINNQQVVRHVVEAFDFKDREMPPHGPGLFGAAHSHDPEFPDDAWNLYSMIERVTALNSIEPENSRNIFTPHVYRCAPNHDILSDADQELIVEVRFTSPVIIRKLMVIGGAEVEHHPSHVKCYVNREGIDFTNVESFQPTQQFDLPVNVEGTAEILTPSSFSNIMTLVFYFPTNCGSDVTILRYIGMQGEHTHYRREAVDTVYEVLCTGQDILQPEDAVGGHSHMH